MSGLNIISERFKFCICTLKFVDLQMMWSTNQLRKIIWEYKAYNIFNEMSTINIQNTQGVLQMCFAARISELLHSNSVVSFYFKVDICKRYAWSNKTSFLSKGSKSGTVLNFNWSDLHNFYIFFHIFMSSPTIISRYLLDFVNCISLEYDSQGSEKALIYYI